ncbi:tetratricopeptide repeat protein [Verrucomicrobia bacterium]|jgi:lipoprotein NlpI|nr:tetratricopeptide repeat protein [Verrucomicrobiota bacterium]MDA7866821.1 tetratricopeptide repeat protein [Verrucomicrobiota bacterium]
MIDHIVRSGNARLRESFIRMGMWGLLVVSVALVGQDSDADLLYKRTISAYNAGKLDEALELARKAIGKEKNDPKLYLTRGYIFQYQREYQKAVDDFTKVVELDPSSVDAWQRRGEENFKLAKFKDSVADFEKVVTLQPQRKPYHWQLGISYYYTGQHKEGQALFESHQTVNSSDVENAVWHYLCVANALGVDEAKKRLLPIPNDTRVPMMQVYALFGGKGTEENVIEKAHEGRVIGGARSRQIFYAHLYLGIYHEILGNDEKAYDYIKKAAQQYKENGYMGQVARAHKIWLDRQRAAKND